MDERFVGVIALVMPVMAIIAGVFMAVLSMMQKAKLRELRYRERIAMIERGLMPPPETDPERFEEAFSTSGLSGAGATAADVQQAARHRTAGIVLFGIGFALMFLIGIAGGAPETGFGIGGAIVIIGVAFIVNSVFRLRDAQRMSSSPAPRRPVPTRDPLLPPGA